MRARLGNAFVVLGVGALALRALACVDLASLGNGPPRDAAAESAPNDDGGADDGTSGPSDPCAHAAPTEAPAADESPNDELPPFVVAIDTATLDPKQAPGFDLDGVCTCDSRPGTAADGGPSCVSRPNVACDLDGGVDNMLGSVAVVAAAKGIDKTVNRLIANGQRTLVLRISRYNGLANDTDVAIGAILAEGIHTKTCPDSTFVDATGTWTPGRCGDDLWALSSAFVSGAGATAIVGTGFVHDYRLVVRFTLPVTLPFTARTAISFREAMISGTVVPLGVDLQPRDATRPPRADELRFYRLEDGLLVGRTATSEVLAALGHYPWGADGGALCHEAVFDFVRETICASADIALRPGGAATDACDALSAAVGFVAIPAQTGASTPSPAPPNECTNPDGGALECP